MEQLEIEIDTTHQPTWSQRHRTTISFWLLGLLNNTAYVVMNAGAKEITPCLVGLVYVANVVPSLLVKLTLPFWQHRVGYFTRLAVATTLMFVSFFVVILGQIFQSPGLQLLGVACGATQSGLGEASLLAMASLYGEDSRKALTAWSSGTGFAGIFGYAYVILFTVGFQASFSVTLMVGLFLPISYCAVFFKYMDPPSDPSASSARRSISVGSGSGGGSSEGFHRLVCDNSGTEDTAEKMSGDNINDESLSGAETTTKSGVSELPRGRQEMMVAVLALWPYTVPLFTVYFAEYAMQSGAWAAIGFPLKDQTARKDFYKFANFSYQIGVFFSRSSGTIVTYSKRWLWVMPVLQIFFLFFFWSDAAWMFWYDWSLLIPCFITGLLGGAVYVGVFTLINVEIPKGPLREFSLSAASVADSVGILFSDLLGIAIQTQLYNMHGLANGCVWGGGGGGGGMNVTNVTQW